MTMLVDWQIAELSKGATPLITPFDKRLLNPASYDVTLQKEVKIQSPGSRAGAASWQNARLPMLVPKGTLVIAAIEQKIILPKNMAAIFYLKSSRAREGWDHLNARFADPGYEGNLTLEIIHHSSYDMQLKPFMKFGQLIFHKLNEVPEKDYSVTGRYQGDTKPQLSRG